MARFEESISINAPAGKVFEYIGDLARHPDWSARPLQMRKTTEGPITAGTTYESTGKQFGTHTDTVRVLEYEPPSRFAFEADGDAGVVRHHYSISEAGGVSTVKKVMEVVKPKLSTKIFMPVVRMVAPKDAKNNLGLLKKRIEGSA